MNPDDHSEIKSWIESFTGAPDFVDFLAQNCSIGMWLSFTHLMRPEFIEVHGCVLWGRTYDPESFEVWRQHLKGDVYAIENTLNRFIVADVVQCEETPENDRALADISEVIAESWEKALTHAFPDRSFEVHVLATEDGPTVVFYQVRG